ncbi:MAG: oligosaccharide flippase family protein, partial [Ignavibacteria bacterium]|nr:oligosaccharide flippase family protein [Ignavibacteria bacterium]
GLSFLFGNLFFQLDTLLIGVWLGDISAGIYRSAFYIMVMMLMIPDIAISSSLPKLSRAFIDDKAKWEYFSRIIYKFLLILALPVCMITYFYPELILTIIYGKIESYDAVNILRIFSIVLLIRFIVEPFGLMLTTSNRQIIRMFIVASATILSFVLNYLFVIKYGLLAVAYISLVVNIFVGAAYILFSAKYFMKWLFEYRNIGIISYASLLSFFLYITGSSYLVLALSIVSFPIFIYFIGFGETERDEIISSIPLINKFRIAR